MKRTFSSICALTLVHGADIIKDNLQAITFEGTHHSDYSTDWLFGDYNWAMDCMDNIKDGVGAYTGLGVYPFSHIVDNGEAYLGYYIELSS